MKQQQALEENSELSGLLLKAGRIIISETLRRKILKVLHEGRPGIAAMKAFTRYYIWWLDCDRDIQTFVEKCYPCQGNPENVLDQPLFSWNAPSKPWT
ncbi:Uncharacterized protein T03_13737 [Trichinella britovi]|uniref:RNA-directed DNA polymerase n=1 Tax=Trichinella britovi TaxID=45882 RepID=A0A0V1C7D6_TRIBR|nr:Uncharacterized protein T03_13737 [Trichinella britovi]